jgi:hypothetical protein
MSASAVALTTLKAEDALAQRCSVLITNLSETSPLLSTRREAALEALRSIFIAGSADDGSAAVNLDHIVATAKAVADRRAFVLKCHGSAMTARAKLMLDRAGVQCQWVADDVLAKLLAEPQQEEAFF